MTAKKARVPKSQPSLPSVPPPQMGEIKKPTQKTNKPEPAAHGQDLFIVDNSDEQWTAKRYLYDWCDIAKSMDIATGFFEIGSLLALDGKWQKLDEIRILMGDQATVRTRQALLERLRQHVCQKLDASLEGEKESNDLLAGTAAIVQAMQQGKIQCRVYAKRKFHAKA